MDHFSGSSGPEEDPLQPGPIPPTVGEERDSLDDIYDQSDGWVKVGALLESLTFEAMMSWPDECCPRCENVSFLYGSFRFCSQGCPENVTAAKPSN